MAAPKKGIVSSPDAAAGVKMVVSSLAESWNRHDMTAFAGAFSEDADFVNVVGMHWQGRQEIEAKHKATVMIAMRSLIGWMYSNTKSVPLAQLMHASSTGSLVMLSPPRVNARQEVVWYLVYAAALWVTVGLIAGFFDSRFRRSNARLGKGASTV